MNAFILCTGRCGSVTVAKALSHAQNYMVGHESRANRPMGRLWYPNQHIEVDNRLAWFLGELDARFPEAVWVHLTREREKVVESYTHRFNVRGGIMPAFASGILRRGPARPSERLEIARLYVDTVTTNILQFLKHQNQDKVVHMRIEHPYDAFAQLWELLKAEGDFNEACAELAQYYNARGKT